MGFHADTPFAEFDEPVIIERIDYAERSQDMYAVTNRDEIFTLKNQIPFETHAFRGVGGAEHIELRRDRTLHEVTHSDRQQD